MQSWGIVSTLTVALLLWFSDHVESKAVKNVKSTTQANNVTSMKRALNEEIPSSVTTEQNIPTHTPFPSSQISVKVILGDPDKETDAVEITTKSSKQVKNDKSLRRSKNRKNISIEPTGSTSESTTESEKGTTFDSKDKESQSTTETLKTSTEDNTTTENVNITPEKVETIIEKVSSIIENIINNTEKVVSTTRTVNETSEKAIPIKYKEENRELEDTVSKKDKPSSRSTTTEEDVEKTKKNSKEKDIELNSSESEVKHIESNESLSEEVSTSTKTNNKSRRTKFGSKYKTKKGVNSQQRRRSYNRRRPKKGEDFRVDDDNLEMDTLVGDNPSRNDDYAKDFGKPERVSSVHGQFKIPLQHDLANLMARSDFLGQSNAPNIEYLLKQATLEHQLHSMQPSIVRNQANPIRFETYINRNPVITGGLRNHENTNIEQVAGPITYPQLNLRVFPGYLNHHQPPLVQIPENRFYPNMRTIVIPNQAMNNNLNSLFLRQTLQLPYGINNINI